MYFLQIWFLPNMIGKRPRYEERHFVEAEKRGRLCAVASPVGAGHSTIIHAHPRMFSTLLGTGERMEQAIRHGCFVYIHIARGTVSLNGTILGGRCRDDDYR